MTSSKKSIFFRRLASTLTLWVVILGTILMGWEPGIYLIISGLGLIALWEFFTMLDASQRPNFKIFGMICGLAMLTGGYYWSQRNGPPSAYDFELAILMCFMLGVFARQMFQKTRDPSPIETMAYTIFGLLYVVWLFSFIIKVVYIVPRNADHSIGGQFYLLYLLVVTKFSDMGAYITGSLIGKHKLVPHISPAKTWEGFFGALGFSLIASVGLWKLLPQKLSLLNLEHCIVLGLSLGFAAIIGDLGESLIKRSANVKDSGSFLPGIGGSLDLIDSLLFTAPLLYFYLRLVILPL
ncbi:MAG: phosphatidate cytidylyltransferase [Chthoniobacterales bacterium]